ncbi:uncharacterized protein LOC111712908 [Eurytemora carolleeae]|uniref:uncharacterized protein LOC111712908 n=1 Tax=Eurytemora carolleeae TaxID=1294199 RepID=UPI000C76AFE8|nr:uncharacterized protein LOC111712908 [Eurytemora carolleeae]|eukprot:XP_023343432.1 uncharacterized protein LOC111712908 [Eurytemora affinis]
MKIKIKYFGLLWVYSTTLVQGVFKCPSDGHFPDPENCASYYHCANDHPYPGACSPGLLWNGLKDECDFPENVNCEISLGDIAQMKVKDGTFIYMTFDDGPNEGTPYVLDALQKYGVRATFFINSDNLHEANETIVNRNKQSIIRILTEGHVLGDHSYDHMVHNTINDSPRNAYKGMEDDIMWFGQRSIDPVTFTIKEAGFDEDAVNYVTQTMWNNIRLPFSNNWRVGPISHDCYPCTVPPSSGNNGVELAKALSMDGAHVFGWDLEWNMDYNINRYRYDGSAMFYRLNPRGGKLPGKIIVLSHDIAHRPGGNIDGQLALETFLQLSLQKGYKFNTVDTYLTDNDNQY